jgi:hypothetical protein
VVLLQEVDPADLLPEMDQVGHHHIIKDLLLNTIKVLLHKANLLSLMTNILLNKNTMNDDKMWLIERIIFMLN